MAFDAFIKLDEVDGESTDSKHAKWIEIDSFSFGVSQAGGGSRSSQGYASGERASLTDFNFLKKTDSASPVLFLKCCQGDSIKEVKVELCRATGNKEKYLEFKMENVFITSYQPAGSSGGDLPNESLSLNYSKLTLNYIKTDPKTGKPAGNVEKFWSTLDNTGG